MKNRSVKMLVILTVACSLIGCSTVLYVPNGQNVPLLKEKNEIKLTATGNLGGYSEGFEAQTAWAAGNNVGIIANAFHTTILDAEQTDTDGFPLKVGKSTMGEIGVGYFNPFKNDKMIVECYGGLGLGKLEIKNQTFGRSTSNFMRFFVQPSLGRVGDHVEFAVSTRIILLNYYNQEHELSGAGTTSWIIDRNQTHFLVEPAFTFRAGWRNIKFQLQPGVSLSLTEIYNVEEFPHDFFVFNLGVNVALRPKKKNK